MPTTPYMSLVLPTVSVTLGPEWATELNAALTLVDSHDHTTGEGVAITPAAININADLEFNSNDATELRSVRLESQSSALAVGTDLGCLYNLSGNPTWNNNSGTSSRIINASYPFTAGDLLYASNTTTIARLGIGTSGQILKVSGGLPSWASQGASLAISDESSASFSASSSVDLYLCSRAGTQAVAIPVSTGGGKQFIFKKTSTAYTSIVTLSRSGSDVFVDSGSSVTSTTLNTLGEEIVMVDVAVGTWQIITRRIPSIWTAYTITYAGTGTVTNASAFYRRNGDSLDVMGYATTGTVTGDVVSASLPASLAIDTAKMTVANANNNRGQNVGTYGAILAAASGAVVTATASSTGLLYFGGLATGANILIPQVGTTILANTESFAFKAQVPISGWNG